VNGRWRRPPSPVAFRRFTLLRRFGVVSFVVFLVLGATLAVILGRSVQDIALAEAQQNAYDTLHARLLHHVTPRDLTAQMTGARYRAFDTFVKSSILSDRTLRVKVWDPHGKVIYSNDRAILGHTFPLEGELAEALDGQLTSEVSDLRKSENRDDRRFGTLLEVYIPIQFHRGGKVFGAFEVYQSYGPVARQINSLQHVSYALLGGGLLTLYVLLFGIVRRGSNTITEQQRRLQQSEERFRSLVQNASDVITVVDERAIVQYQGSSVERVLGYAPEALEGTQLFDLVPPRDTSMMRAFLAEAATRPGLTGPVECQLRRHDGSVVPGEIVATNLLKDPNVRGIVLTIRDIGERKRAQAALEYQALHDGLTSLPNRALLHDRAQQAIAVASRTTSPVALLLMDLDRFKEINDTFGHHYGDLLLQQFGQRLHGVLRDSDTVARLGGDEFAILLPDTDERAAVVVAEKILQALRVPIDVDGNSLDVGASIGIALCPEHGTDAHILLQRADVAMYHAKRTDSGTAVYAVEHDGYSPDRLVLIRELREAIEHDQLLLYYQPKVNLKTRHIESVEALVRWQHPERGVIPPDQFIPLAEHTGLIRPLTSWVLSRALRQCCDWHTVGLPLKVAVNISARSLHDPQLAPMVEFLLQTWRVPAEWLELELTETTLMADPGRGAETLRRLHDMGVKIAIDDYGSGYSSLAYLKGLPLDTIKIDKSFVQEMAANEGDAFIVRSVADLGHSLGLEVVAEGAEDHQTVRLLTMMGCDLVQGYYVSRPLPPEALVSWFTTLRSRSADRRETTRHG
jgi:diguanylate cyclase (GGDEF)-like protein/PAS domain S-box-containing protein